MRLYGARFARAYARIEWAVSASSACPDASVTYAFGTASRTVCVAAPSQICVGDRRLRPISLNDSQRDAVGLDHVEPVKRPIEILKPRPLESGEGRVVLLAILEEEVARSAEHA